MSDCLAAAVGRCGRVVIGNGCRLVDMQVAQLSVGTSAVIVIYAISGIGILLNLAYQKTFAYCVNGTGLNKEYVTGFCLNTV